MSDYYRSIYPKQISHLRLCQPYRIFFSFYIQLYIAIFTFVEYQRVLSDNLHIIHCLFLLNPKSFTPLDLRSDSVQFLVDIFIPPVDLVDIVNHALSRCGEGSDQQGDSGTDIRRGHFRGTQL